MASFDGPENEQPDMETTNTRQPYILYYNQYSVCSLMVCLTLAFARCNNNRFPDIKEKSVDIQRRGQLEEYYLCDINPRGTVGAFQLT